MQHISEEHAAIGFDTFSFSFPWHTDEPYIHNLKVCLCVPLEIGIQMSLPVEVKPVL